MRDAYRVADVRAAEQALMATLPAGALMQRAAAGLATRCAGLLADGRGGVYGARVVLLAGSGDNGGDALYAGARLARRGASVTAVLLAPDRAHRGGLAALRAAGGRVVTAGSAGRAGPDVVGGADLVVDGIVGIGARGGLRDGAREVVRAVRAGGAPVVAVDVPSGIEVDTGAVPEEDDPDATVRADVTVTFGAYKPGLLVGAAVGRAGLVELVDIGLRPHLTAVPALRVPDAVDVAGWWPVPGADDDKYTRGVVGVATGSERYTGAAVLSVGAALAGPTGFVRYAGHAAEHVRLRWPAAVITDRVGDAGRVQSWVAGSGLGTDARAKQELRAVLAADVPTCVDADGLTMLSDGPEGWLANRTAPVVLTPHDREYARLAGGPPGPDRIAAARALAAKLGVVVLLKGDRTVVAAPGDGPVYVNPTGTPALATAGTGDVLAGLLGAALGAGIPAPEAAAAAAFVHGLAGRRAAAQGPVSAHEVLGALRGAIRSLTPPLP
jgi:hydroxyethylthiazole kinase-like uncharacterized protein yjeF